MDERTGDLIAQNHSADVPTLAECVENNAAGHDKIIPADETVVRIPARMIPIPKETIEAAERAAVFDELLARARHSAVRLELRGGYAVADEGVDYRRWRETGERDTDTASPCWAPWVGVVRVAARRDVAMRVRVAPEPVSDCIRYEHVGTAVNTAAGKDVRWLPRGQAVGLLLPFVDGDGPPGHPAGGAADGSRPGAA
ncbi:DUF6879 family protein [Streptomyces sp. NPDC014861]|uniref:DUF6879 family protein n=1 Tax=Streptomyces sp. NPDC014861 TaxID=3364923 RepID=UPI003700C9E0